MVDAEMVPLADFVAALRDEIRQMDAGADEQSPIELGPVTVEFTLLTRHEGAAGAKVKFWVVEAGVEGKVTGESTQKVTLELHPLQPGGVGRRRVRRSGPPG